MATPTFNSVPTTDYTRGKFSDEVDVLLNWGTKWGGALGVVVGAAAGEGGGEHQR